MIMCRAAILLLPLLLASPAQAAQATDAPAPAGKAAQTDRPPDAKSDKGWQFSTITYVWAAGAKGKVDVIGPLLPVDLDLSFGDVLKSFKFAFMGSAEARHDRFVLLGDLLFIHLGATHGIDIRDRDFVDAKLDTRTIDVTALAGYRVADKGPMTVDLLGGGRLNFLKNSLELEGPNRREDGSVSQTWFDPLVGARVGVPLGGKFGFSLYGDVGGFGIGSDVTWQGMGTIDYDINPKWRVMAGYRYFKVDYRKGDFLYDVAQRGPIILVRTRF